jgi:hypothetical protein
VLTAGVALLALSACSQSAVPVAVPSPAAGIAAACAELTAALPDRLTEGKRRDTEPESPLTAAYGDPPIELTCGVAPPAGMADPAKQCFEVNGVGWYAEEAPNGVIFTTIGRKLYVEVAVPDDYAPEAEVLTDLAATLQAKNPVVTPCA